MEGANGKAVIMIIGYDDKHTVPAQGGVLRLTRRGHLMLCVASFREVCIWSPSQHVYLLAYIF